MINSHYNVYIIILQLVHNGEYKNSSQFRNTNLSTNDEVEAGYNS